MRINLEPKKNNLSKLSQEDFDALEAAIDVIIEIGDRTELVHSSLLVPILKAKKAMKKTALIKTIIENNLRNENYKKISSSNVKELLADPELDNKLSDIVNSKV